MALITKFEDIQAWQQARTLTQEIYQVTKAGAFSRDFGLRDQIQRATVSSMTNVAEGFDCDSKVEFARFLGIAQIRPWSRNQIPRRRWSLRRQLLVESDREDRNRG